MAECEAEPEAGTIATLGWQPSRFLTDRAEAERAFALAERLGSVNAATTELGTTWPSLRKAFAATGWVCQPMAPRQFGSARLTPPVSAAGARQPLDPVFVALNSSVLPARERSPAELYQWVRRDEEYVILGANVVVELNSESRARRPTTRAWAIIRRADRAQRLAADRGSRAARRIDRTGRPRAREEREVTADAR
jgi:hypothetical protein